MKNLLFAAVVITLLPLYVFAYEIIAVPDPANTDCSDGKCWLDSALIEAGNFLLWDDVLVKVARGTYKAADLPGNVNSFVFDNRFENDLRIEGGYDENGQNRVLDPTNTVIEGVISEVNEETRGCLYLQGGAGGSIFVEGLTFRNSNHFGLQVYTTAGQQQNQRGNITIQNNIFQNIQDGGFGLGFGLKAWTEENQETSVGSGAIFVRGNLFESSGKMSVAAENGYGGSGTIEFEDNTIVNNACVSCYRILEHHGMFGGSPGYIGVKNNIIIQSQSVFGGGGLYVRGRHVVVENNIIQNNHSNGPGGGILVIAGDEGPRVKFVNNIISGNVSVGGGGGVAIDVSPFSPDPDYPLYGSSEVDIINNTITGNTSLSTEVAGNGLYFTNLQSGGWNNELALTNNIIWGNTDASHSGYDIGLYFHGYGYTQYNNFNALFELNPDHNEKTNNINVDPDFVSPSDNNFRLKAGSPCIDSGSPWHHPPFDFEGDFRPFDGDGDGVAVVDIGADEYINWPVVISFDFGTTDCGPAGSCHGDFDQDNDVDGSDLAILAARLDIEN